jgi:hypothetical protein
MIKKIEKYNDIEFYDDLQYENQNILIKLIEDIKLDIKENKEKIKKLNYVYPKYIFIFDDFSELLKDKSLEGIIKRHRHYLTSFIISS